MAQINCVAIIILNHNKKNDLLECIESIYRQDYKNFRIIIVDNGSVDGSAEAVKNKYPGVNLIENKINSGAAGGRNIGIKFEIENFNCKHILFLDNDVIVEKKTISEMVESFDEENNIGIVTPKCYMMNFPGVIGYAGGISVNLFTGKIADIGGGEKDSGQFDESGFVSASGGLCLMSKEVINKVGLFDERFNPYGWEDVDYSLRAVELGFKIYYNHKAVTYHKGGKKQRETMYEYEFSKAKNYFYLLNKHANFFQLISAISILPFKGCFIIAKELLRGEFKILYSQFRAVLYLIKQ